MPEVTLKQLLEHLNAGQAVRAGSEMHKLMIRYSNEAMRITAQLNSVYHEPKQVRRLLAELTGDIIDDSLTLFPPFYTDFGKNIHIGKNVFINCCCCFQDQGGISIGDGALIGHKVVIATINHGRKPEDRKTNYPAAVRIGKNVWLGANVTVVPGVSIGDNAIVGAGAVVTKNVEAGATVAGVPAKPIPAKARGAKNEGVWV